MASITYLPPGPYVVGQTLFGSNGQNYKVLQLTPFVVEPLENAITIAYDNATSGLASTNVQAAIDEVQGNILPTDIVVDNGDGTYTHTANDLAVVTIDTNDPLFVDNGNGTFTQTRKDGTTVTFNMNTATVVNNLDGTYTWSDAGGTSQIINTKDSTFTDNGDGTYTVNYTDGSTFIIDTNSSTVVDNGDGTYTHTSSNGTSIIINTNSSTLVDNGNGTITHTSSNGVATTFSTIDSSWFYNSDGTYTVTYADGSTFTIDGISTDIVDNGNGTYTWTNAAGKVVIIDTNSSTVVNNGNGTYTHNNGDGISVIIDTRATANPYSNATSGLAAVTVQAAIDEIDAKVFKSVVTDNSDGTYTHNDGNGVVKTIDTRATSNPYSNATSGLTASTVQTAIDEINAKVFKSVVTDNSDGTYTHNDGNGVVKTIDTRANANPYDNTISGLFGTNVKTAIDEVANPVSTITRIGGSAAAKALFNSTIETQTNLTYSPATTILTYTNEVGNVQNIDLSALTTDLFVNGASLTGTTLHLTDASGVTPDVTIDLSSFLSTFVDNGDGTYTHNDGQGSTFTIDTSASTNPFNNAVSGLAATNVELALNELAASNFTSVFVDNGDGTYTHNDGNGVTVTVDTTAGSNPYNNLASGLTATTVQAAIDEVNSKVFKSVVTDNADGTYTHNDGNGVTVTFDTTAGSNPYNNLASGLAAVTVQAAIDEINAKVFKSVVTDNSDGTYTHNDGNGVTVTVDTTAGSNPYNNLATGLTATNVQAAIDEVLAGSFTSVVTDNGDGTWTHNDGNGNIVNFDANTSTFVDNGDGTFTATSANGSSVTFDAKTTTFVDNGDGTYTRTDVDGSTFTIDTNSATFVDNGNGTHTWTPKIGAAVTISTSKSVVTDNADGTYTHNDGTGSLTTISTTAGSNPFTPAQGISSTDVQAAIEEIMSNYLYIGNSGSVPPSVARAWFQPDTSDFYVFDNPNWVQPN